MTPQERRPNHVFSQSQSATGTIAIRLTVFVLTACLGQVFANLFHYRQTQEHIVSVSDYDAQSLMFSPVEVVSAPAIDFPKPLKKLDALDFWITSSLEVGADGTVQDIRVPADLEATTQDESFAKGVLDKLSAMQRGGLEERLFQHLRNQLENTKFKPRISEGRPFPTQVYMSSHFKWDGKLCWKVETEFTTASGTIWDRIDANHQLEQCVGY